MAPDSFGCSPVFFHASAIHSSAAAILVLSIYTHPLSCATTVLHHQPCADQLPSSVRAIRPTFVVVRMPPYALSSVQLLGLSFADTTAHRYLYACIRRASTHSDIESLSGRLQEERLLRQQREQYAVLARRINAYPSREQTQARQPRSFGFLMHISEPLSNRMRFLG